MSEALPRQGALLVNSKARRGSELFEQAKTALCEGGFNLVEARMFRQLPDLQETLKKLIEQDIPMAVIGGGDGTMSAVASMLCKRSTVLGVLPLGTGNAFARDLGIQAEVEKACDVVLNGKLAEVNMSLAGDRAFLNVATVGLSTRIALGLDPEAKKRFGKAAYALSLIKAIATVKPFHVLLELPTGTEEFDSLQVVIGNGRFHAGPFPVTEEASITSGRLSIYTLASRRKTAFLEMAVYLLGGAHIKQSDVKSFEVTSGRLVTDRTMRVTVDGETCMRTPFEFKVLPEALRVAVPQAFLDSPSNS